MSREKPQSLRDLFEQEYVSLARLPPNNDFLVNERGEVDLSRLEGLEGYTILLTDVDYGAATPAMWNSLYKKLGLNILNFTVVADPKNLGAITSAFREDPKYLGGGCGSGFKEKIVSHLDEVEPEGLEVVNNFVKRGGRLVGYNTDAIGFVKSLDDSLGKIGKKIEGSNLVVLGLGGAAKPSLRLIAEKKPKLISVVNRTLYGKDKIGFVSSVSEESGVNIQFVGEKMSREVILSSLSKPDAVINFTKKGANGPLLNYSAFWEANIAEDSNAEINLATSREIARELKKENPEVLIADIVLLDGGRRSKTLEIASGEGLENILDGRPMVINQAVPAYIRIQEAYPELHKVKVFEEEALRVFKEAVGK